MQLVPQSWGSPLREFNPCHDPKDGKFATRTAGRCADDALTGLAKARRKLGPELYRTYVRRQATIRQAIRMEQSSLPRHLRLDAARAARDERATVQYVSKQPDDYMTPSFARRGPRTAVIRQNPTKSETLAVLRHEIGHITPMSLGRGGHVVSGTALKLSSPAQRRYIEEVRAWKNAIVAARGRVNIQRDVRDRLQSYWGPVAKSLLPRAPSLKKMTADAFTAQGETPPEMRGVGYQGWGGQTPGAAYVLGKNPALRRAVRQQKAVIARQRKARALELEAGFDRQIRTLERFARVVRRAAAVERRARRKVA